MNTIKVFSAFLLILFCSSVVLAQTNLLNINPGFELGKKGWYYQSNSPDYVLVIDDVHEGAQSLKISSHKGMGVSFIYTSPTEQRLSIEKNKKYKFELWIKPLNKSNGIVFRVYAVSGSFHQGQDIELTRPAKLFKPMEWQLVSFEFSGNDYPAAKCSFGVNLGDYLIDGFKLYEIH